MDAGDVDEADQQVVLEELYDENYEPTEAEVLEYARWLGMDTESEKELLWIARAGLKEPVPEGWKPCQAPSKEIYYFNFISGESIWDHPCDEHFRKLYAQEKARLEERRELQAQQQEEQSQQHGEQQDEPEQQQLQQWPGPEPSPQQQLQPAKSPTLLVPDNNAAVQHTEVESLTSPSGTLSTIASGTTVSVAESPVGGLAHGAFQLEAAQQQGGAVAVRPSLANGTGGVELLGGTPQPSPAPAAATAQPVRRSLMGSVDNSDAALIVAASDWQAAVAAADQEERLRFRQQVEDERMAWEQHLQADVHAQHNALQQQHQQRLWSINHELQEQEQMASTQLRAEQDARLNSLRLELQATLKGLEQELHDAKVLHAAHMQQLHSQHEEVEAHATNMLQQAQKRLSATTVADSEVSAARDKATAAVEMEAAAEASGHRSELLQTAMKKVEQEVSQEVAAYKASRKADALQQLAGHLSEDTAAAAQQLETQTAELQRLEAAIADRAAVLQKLSDEVASKQREQLQQQRQLLDSLSGSVTGEHRGDAQLLSSCREQLASVQQQLAQDEKQLAAADSTLVEKRAAVAEAEEQLAALRRETSVCEPRLSSLRQQLQELEATIRARDAEQQQRQADVALSSKRLAELREEVSRRQGQLDSLESLYAERQESLRQTANELAFRRGELSTLESSLSESLRRKADAEYQALEERLRRTRKAAADAASELSSRQATLADLSAHVSSKQVSLEGIEASLAAKSKELQEVLAQLQAAAAQEFQDAKKLLLEEEARLLESERRSMRMRVSDQIESERRAALAAGRRRNEREVSTRLAEEQSASLEYQQKHVKQWLEAAASGMHVLDNSLGGPSSSSPAADGAADKAGRTRTASATGPGVAAILGQGSTWVGQQQAAAAGSMHIVPGPAGDAAAGGGSAELAPSKAYAAALDGARRRARSHSPVRSRHTVAEAAAGAAKPRPSVNLADEFSKLLQLQGAAEGRGARDGTDKASAAAAVQRLSQALLAASEPAADHSGVSVGLQAAAAAVLDQLKALGAQQGGGSDSSNSWLAELPALDMQLQAGPLANQQVPGSAQLAAYTTLLHQAKQFIKQRRRDILQRQEAVMAAQADWKAVLAAMEEQQQAHQAAGTAAPAELAQAVQQLRQLKVVLQDQIHQLNDETQQVKGLKARVQQLKATVELLQLQAQQQEQPDPTISNLSSLLASLSGLQHRQQHWQQQQQRQSGFLPSSRVPLQPHNQQQSLRNMLPPSSPLDKVTAALQAALDAATSRSSTQAAALGPFEGAVAASGASSSRRSSLSPWPPNGTAAGSAAELAGEGSWGTLNKLRDERGAAQQAMRQHSQWLQGFREQVAQVAALQPAVASKLHFQAMDNKALPRARSSAAGPAAVQQLSPAGQAGTAGDRADGGGSTLSHAQSGSAGLSPVASSSLLPMASAGSLSLGQPLTVDLGSDQLVISLVHKSAAS